MRRALFVTELDGTLLGAGARIGPATSAALHGLGQRGIVRAVATGRSLHALKLGLPLDAPIDYAIFSTGVAAVRWEAGSLEAMLLSRSMDAVHARRAADICIARGMNVMILAPAPDTHRVAYVRRHALTGCLDTRLGRLGRHCMELELNDQGHAVWEGPASQILALPPPGDGGDQHRQLCNALPEQHVVRTTSPYDADAVWLEVFPQGVSKGSAMLWLAEHCGIEAAATHAVGNDYNDVDMLQQAARACVVANAPGDLRARFDTVARHDEDGVAEAIARFGL